MEASVTEQQTSGALAAALIAARKRCTTTVHKAGRNETQRYTYVGHEHVLTGGARDALLENGLVLLLESYEMVGADSYKTQGGDKQCWRWRGRFLLVHTSGEQLALSYEATTVPNDKAGFVASTALDRTAHMRVLELAGSDEENPEHDSNEPPKERVRKTRERPAASNDPPRTAKWWRDQHNALCDRAFKAAGIVSGPADEYGLHPPQLPMPKFSDKAKQYPGLAYNHPDVKPGYLRQVIWMADDFAQQPAPVRLHVSHLVARHEIRKLEDAAAEQALGKDGAA
jgi:hypothetical protein